MIRLLASLFVLLPMLIGGHAPLLEGPAHGQSLTATHADIAADPSVTPEVDRNTCGETACDRNEPAERCPVQSAECSGTVAPRLVAWVSPPQPDRKARQRPAATQLAKGLTPGTELPPPRN